MSTAKRLGLLVAVRRTQGIFRKQVNSLSLRKQNKTKRTLKNTESEIDNQV